MHLSTAPPDRTSCASRMSALEQSIHKFAEEPISRVQVTVQIIMLLKQQSVRAILHLSQAKNARQLDMFKFSDQLLRSLSHRCVCSPARGFTDCPLTGIGTSNTADHKNTLACKIRGQILDLSNCKRSGNSLDVLGESSHKCEHRIDQSSSQHEGYSILIYSPAELLQVDA
ncbi:hypothetical protein VPH35_100789 [Triticum aestivum]